MALSVLAAPATTLLSTLAHVKDEVGVTDGSSDSDDLLTDLLARASSAITRECGRPAFGLGQYQETLKGSGSQLLGLTCVPILAVAQVLQDQDVLDPADPQDGYTIEDAEAGALYRAAGWGQGVATLAWGSAAYGARYILPGGTGTLRYTVTYTAGYLLPPQADYRPYDPTAGVTLDRHVPPTVPNEPPVLNRPALRADPPPLPGAIEQACLLTVKAWWFGRTRDATIGRVQTADQAVVYQAPPLHHALPTAALGLLRDYRRVA